MHSSRLRTARSLTVSRSIGGGRVGGVLPNPPRCRPPWMQTPLWMQTPTQMQTPLLDAVPPPGCRPPGCGSPCGQTNTCENITLPQTSFSGGKKGFDLIDQTRQSFASATPSTSAINVSVCKKGSFPTPTIQKL